MNESEDPESTRDISWVSGMVLDVTGIMRASGVVMVALRVMVFVHEQVIHSPQGVRGVGGCLIFFCLLDDRLL